jgi:hypothetical protein
MYIYLYLFPQIIYTSSTMADSPASVAIPGKITLAAFAFAAGVCLSSCASLPIPAPQDAAIAFEQPPIEDSTIAVPLSVSIRSGIPAIDSFLERQGSDGSVGSAAARVRKFLERQASKHEDLLQNEYVKQAAVRAWDALQQPVRVQDDVFLLLNPESLQVSPSTEQNGMNRGAVAVLEITARPKLFAGSRPEPASHPTPSFTVGSAPRHKGFHLALESVISFDFVGRELTEQFRNKVYAHKGRTLKIEDVRAYASGKAVVLAVRIDGERKGTIYLSGIPEYDGASRSLVLRNLDYTVETRNVLDRIADWMLHTELRRKLEDRAKWPLDRRMDEARRVLDSALNREITQHVAFEGAVKDIRPVFVGCVAGSIKTVLVADGDVEVRVF